MQQSSSFEDSPYGVEAMTKAKDLFQVCDVETKGFIIKRDMQRLSGELPGLTPDQLEEVFDSLDQDGNGFLTMEEFVKGFGAFLGLQIDDFESDSEFESQTQQKYVTNQESLADEIANEEVLEEVQFKELVTHLGAQDVFEDNETVKNMWTKMRKDDPELLTNFEHFLAGITVEMKRAKEELGNLEGALTDRTTHHDDEVKKLYDEMEVQIRQEKERVVTEERQRAEKIREEMEQEIEEKNAQLQEIVQKHQELEKRMTELSDERTATDHEKERLRKERQAFSLEKDKLEQKLERTQHTLSDSKSQLEQVKKQIREEKRERFKSTFKVTENIATEREGLVNQLDSLRTINKKLKDERDVGDRSYLQQRDSKNGSTIDLSTSEGTEGGKKHIGSIGAMGGSIGIESDCEVDDDFLSNTMSSHPFVPSGHSLLDELGQALGDSAPSPGRERLDPLGGHDEAYSTKENMSSNESSQMDPNTPDRVFKVVFVGDSGVGKTCFLHRYCQNRFKPTFSATIGVDFQVKSVVVENRMIALQLWDTAGQERFRSITKQYFRKADGVVLMYDVTSELSFINLRNWVQQVREGVDESCVLLLIGNKCDLIDALDENRGLKFKDGQRLAEEFSALFFETSASTAEGINESMKAMAMLLREREDNELEKALTLGMEGENKRKCCGKRK